MEGKRDYLGKNPVSDDFLDLPGQIVRFGSSLIKGGLPRLKFTQQWPGAGSATR
jgi:hypothetical protein